MISVVVPVYKTEKYLIRCIKSIQNQTYKDIKIILVDDGSPDECGKICDELALEDNRIITLHQKNSGQAAARNNGMAWVYDNGFGKYGDYFTFVDSDDTIEPEMYQNLIEMMSENVDIAMCGHRIIREDKSKRKRDCRDDKTVELNADELWNEIFVKLNNAVWNKLYRAELLKDIRFPTSLKHGEDLIFNLEYLIKCTTGRKTSSIFYNYFKRNDSTTTSDFSKTKLMEIESKDAAYELVKKYYPSLKNTAQKYCFRARMNVIRGIYRSGKEKEYANTINECIYYINENYNKVSNSLRFKERVEFLLLSFFRYLYIFLIKRLR